MSRTVRTVLAGVVSAGILLVGAGAAFADSDADSDADSYTEHVHHESACPGHPSSARRPASPAAGERPPVPALA
jgi:hypothetical protein